MSRFLVSSVACACALAILTGCGGEKAANRPKTIRTTVTVTYKGAPVAGATVSFAPSGGAASPAPAAQPGATAAKSAQGTTDSSGKVKMWTFAPGDGVIPGSYQVTVTKIVTPPAPQVSQDELYKMVRQGKKLPQAKNELPAKYATVKTSDLTATVTDGKPADVTLELKD